VDNVTQTDVRNTNIILIINNSNEMNNTPIMRKKILSLEFGIYQTGHKVSVVLGREQKVEPE